MPTIGELLADATERLRAAGSETARLDAELLLGWAVGADRTAIVAHPRGAGRGRTRSPDSRTRSPGAPPASRSPTSAGIKEFHGLAFAVDARALIPRPETEAPRRARARRGHGAGSPTPGEAGAARGGGDPVRVADVGTGSGAIAVALAVELRAPAGDDSAAT